MSHQPPTPDADRLLRAELQDLALRNAKPDNMRDLALDNEVALINSYAAVGSVLGMRRKASATGMA